MLAPLSTGSQYQGGIQTRSAFGTNSSVPVESCQVCGSKDLKSVIFIGYLPPVNTMPPVGSRPVEQPAYPAEVLRCTRCELVQLGLVVDPNILFPPSYPYTSGTTKTTAAPAPTATSGHTRASSCSPSI